MIGLISSYHLTLIICNIKNIFLIIYFALLSGLCAWASHMREGRRDTTASHPAGGNAGHRAAEGRCGYGLIMRLLY